MLLDSGVNVQIHLAQILDRETVINVELDTLEKLLVAKANTNGGLLTIPIENDLLPLAIVKQVKTLAQNCQPAIPIEIEFNEAHAIHILVPRSPQLHATTDGRVYGEIKHDNLQLNSKQIHQLADYKTMGDFEVTSVAGATLHDFDAKLIQKLYKTCNFNLSTEALLINLGLVNHDLQPTVTGILLLSHNPQSWLPQSVVIVNHYIGTEKNNRLAQQHHIKGALQHQFEQISTLFKTMNLPYPLKALDGILLNVLLHRDYRHLNPIEINIWDKALEIVSAGLPPAFVSINTLRIHCFQRNPNLYRVMTLCMGIEQLADLQTIEAQFNSKNLLYHTTLLNHHAIAFKIYQTKTEVKKLLQNSIHLNWRQRLALAYTQKHGSISFRTFRVLCSETDSELLHDDLQQMVDNQLFITIGHEPIYVLVKSNLEN